MEIPTDSTAPERVRTPILSLNWHDPAVLRTATTAFVVLGVLLRLFRYLADFPLWCDEMRVAANLIDLRFGDLGKPLRYQQVAPLGFLALQIGAVKLLGFSTWSLRLVPAASAIASVFVFRHLAGRLLDGVALLVAMAMFAVAFWPIAFAGEVKPYAGDLLISLAILTLAVEWLKNPSEAWRLWLLAGVALAAVPLSLPSVFVTGGVFLTLARKAWREGPSRSRAALLFLGSFPAILFLLLMPFYRLEPHVQAFMDSYWAGAFPPRDGLLHLIGWLAEAHTGTMFAYPVGYAWGAASRRRFASSLASWPL